jgi:hypothetical protein
MKFLDDLIVSIARRLLRAVMAIGTGLVYIQFLVLSFFGAMVATVIVAVIIAAFLGS